MIENITEFWYLYIVLLVLIVITPFVLKKAFGTASRRSKEVNAMIEKAKREKELRDAYRDLTAEIIEKSPAESLFEGTALCLEAKCQKSENTENFYNELTQGQKYIYALYYLLTDAKTELSLFFKTSGKPLTTDAVEGAENALPREVVALIKQMFERYDDENESASVIAEEIEKANSYFKLLSANTNLFKAIGEYIKANPQDFINK